MQEQRVFREFGGVLDIVVVDANQLAAGEHILPGHLQKLLEGLLLAVGEPEEVFVGRHPAVDVDSLEPVEAAGQGVLGAFLRDEGQVEIVAVKVDQIAVGPGKIKESPYHVHLLLIGLCHPLYGVPFPSQEIGAADEVQIGGFGGKAGGLDVEKKHALQGREPVQRISYRKVLQCLLRYSHDSLRPEPLNGS